MDAFNYLSVFRTRLYSSLRANRIVGRRTALCTKERVVQTVVHL
jgi:hypothetical protein